MPLLGLRPKPRDAVSLLRLVAVLAQSFPVEDPLDAFIGSGASGRRDLSQRHREMRAKKTSGLTALGC
jgi:hypothetical protein